jgi:uncharacterized protein YdhG (YjbR/CyaY superfamily)
MATTSDVEEYLAGLPADRRAAMEKLRTTIRAAAPQATETISYRMPAFKLHGRFVVWYAAFRDHYSLYPASEGVLAAHGDELAPYFSGKGTIRFAFDEPLPSALVKKVVKTRIKRRAARRSVGRLSPHPKLCGTEIAIGAVAAVSFAFMIAIARRARATAAPYEWPSEP